MDWSRTAEQALLGAAFLHAGCYDAADLAAECLFAPQHREIWLAIGRLRDSGRPVDPGLVADELGPRLDACGGLSYLSDLISAAAVPDTAPHHAEVIRTHWRSRSLRTGVSEAMGREDLDERVGALYALLGGLESKPGAQVMSDLVSGLWRDLHAQAQLVERGESPPDVVPTGVGGLDRMLAGGLRRGIVTILGGRPGSGKSSLARQIARHAVERGHGVHVFSPEDQARIYTLRALSGESKVDLHRLLSLRGLTRGDLDRLAGAAERLRGFRAWMVDDAAGLSSAQIASRVRRAKRDLDTHLVVVDYIQHLSEPTRIRHGRRAEIDAAIAGLVQLAGRENVAMLVLSQLTRANERENRRPQPSDLRESGDLEQHARAILFTYRFEEDGQQRAQILIAKQSHGPAGRSIDVHFDEATTTFFPQTSRDEP